MSSEKSYVSLEAKQIMLRFPNIFGPPPWSTKDTMLGWGFTCGNGWYPVLEDVFSKMEEIRSEDGLAELRVTQVKEKFGSLRISVRGGNSRIRALIEQAEDECIHICEGCGGPSEGIKNQSGYLTNLCHACISKL